MFSIDKKKNKIVFFPFKTLFYQCFINIKTIKLSKDRRLKKEIKANFSVCSLYIIKQLQPCNMVINA